MFGRVVAEREQLLDVIGDLGNRLGKPHPVGFPVAIGQRDEFLATVGAVPQSSPARTPWPSRGTAQRGHEIPA
jgi:hypothetical protein